VGGDEPTRRARRQRGPVRNICVTIW